MFPEGCLRILPCLQKFFKSLSPCWLACTSYYRPSLAPNSRTLANQEDARRCFDLWTEVFTKTMPANVHLLIAHGHLYLRWAQDDIGIALGALTEGSIEKCNQDVKFIHRRFVAKTSMENIHSNILTRLSWEADPVLHYEETVRQVRPCFILFPKKKVMFALL